jgi:hypothetical protein
MRGARRDQQIVAIIARKHRDSVTDAPTSGKTHDKPQ